MNLAFIDDKRSEILPAMQEIHQILIQNDFNPSIDYFTGGEEFLAQYEPGHYTIIFIDVVMQGITGAETARRIREKEPNVILIFLTSDRESMVDAFSSHAFEYIQKPYSTERIQQVMSDVLKIIPVHTRTLSFSYHRQEIRLPYASIVAMMSHSHHVDIWDNLGNCYTPYSTFSSLSTPLLEMNSFLLLNKGILVNMNHIREFRDKSCIMDNEKIFPVSRRKASALENIWRNYVFSTMIPERRTT